MIYSPMVNYNYEIKNKNYEMKSENDILSLK